MSTFSASPVIGTSCTHSDCTIRSTDTIAGSGQHLVKAGSEQIPLTVPRGSRAGAKSK